MRKLTDSWRSTTARLILIYGTFFALWGGVVIGLIYWQAASYLGRVSNDLIGRQATYFSMLDERTRLHALNDYDRLETRRLNAWGVFDAQGNYLSGTITTLPAMVRVNGPVALLQQGVSRNDSSSDEHGRVRAAAVRLQDGRILLITRDTSIVDRIGTIVLQALLWGLSLTVIPGLFGGLLLSRGPWRRVHAIRQATMPIMQGDLARRLPVSRHGDELDMLAGIVNAMLDEIERLLGEVKGVCDNIAHDLRTPLTRLRSRLYRLQQQFGEDSDETAALDACMVDTDALLDRFRALLRISELENQRRRVGFDNVDLAEILREVHALYLPLAEDRGQQLALDLPALPFIHADRHLLLEALSNLVGNAIKFTPPGGLVEIRARTADDGPWVDVSDSGPGIPPDQRDAVTRRFYRTESSRSTPGSGLGLSIVSAIARLHGYTLEIAGSERGARLSLHCLNATGV
ncbi:HAMP domain-containing sensor histidine kinase [Rhodanobacter sp. MP1X3]|uniref:sensor histidine kinase n=1 Tax=Rhodanobacter sp. MP1X3 TaxID=2723086 RepID=UPI001848EE45|nr:HAMP domain-containing sensor histidine kinase [Rhodanobacter sp. MP1X3]MBB6241122.1 signal transduction histidine kinase [Rhodanobacter sp. MP1X3]